MSPHMGHTDGSTVWMRGSFWKRRATPKKPSLQLPRLKCSRSLLCPPLYEKAGDTRWGLSDPELTGGGEGWCRQGLGGSTACDLSPSPKTQDRTSFPRLRRLRTFDSTPPRSPALTPARTPSSRRGPRSLLPQTSEPRWSWTRSSDPNGSAAWGCPCPDPRLSGASGAGVLTRKRCSASIPENVQQPSTSSPSFSRETEETPSQPDGASSRPPQGPCQGPGGDPGRSAQFWAVRKLWVSPKRGLRTLSCPWGQKCSFPP